MSNDRNQSTNDLFERFVEKDIEGDRLREVLATKKGARSLRVKLGIDPTAPDLHVGHLVPLRLLRAFQELGSTAVLLIGDYTARIGDPSGRDTTRPPLGADTVQQHAETYLKQIENVLDVEEAEIRWQSEWYDDFSLHDVVELLSHASVSQIMEHNTFKERLQKEHPFFMHEAFYPLLQAYDSVVLKADVEIGALDQLFNIAMGRTIQKAYDQDPQAVLVTPYILGTDGRKMSKSFDNTINLTDAPEEVFGKVMSISDKYIKPYAQLLTDLNHNTLGAAAESGGEGARDAKKEVAHGVVRMLFDNDAADTARDAFFNTFSKEEIAEDLLEEVTLENHHNPFKVKNIPILVGWTEKNSEAKRLIEQGGLVIVRDDSVFWKNENWSGRVTLKEGDIVQIGKKNFYRIRLT